jgi:hypothetical protein
MFFTSSDEKTAAVAIPEPRSLVSIQNPWNSLPPGPPYVLPEDAALIRRHRFTESSRIDVDMLPEPYLGDPDAPVVLLNLSPAWFGEDADWHTYWPFQEAARRSLEHAPATYPFYPLNPAFDGSVEHRWWSQKLKPLIERFGAKVIARQIFCVHLFPYRTRRFTHHRLLLPSQEYGLALVRRAITRDALVVAMRSWHTWHGRIEELGESRVVHVSSVQNPTLSEKNLGRRFGQVVAAIERSEEER